MTRREIDKLPLEEQDFIYSYGLEKKSLEDIRFLEENFDEAVYRGWI